MKYSKEIFYQEFIRREDSTNRAPYNPELEFYSIIQNGDIEQVKELCKASPLKDKKGLGLLSEKHKISFCHNNSPCCKILY